jgi:hypothetical protein
MREKEEEKEEQSFHQEKTCAVGREGGLPCTRSQSPVALSRLVEVAQLGCASGNRHAMGRANRP